MPNDICSKHFLATESGNVSCISSEDDHDLMLSSSGSSSNLQMQKQLLDACKGDSFHLRNSLLGMPSNNNPIKGAGGAVDESEDITLQFWQIVLNDKYEPFSALELHNQAVERDFEVMKSLYTIDSQQITVDYFRWQTNF